MKFDHPSPEQVPQLLQLWKQAFGDYGGFWEMFLETAFLADHCRCIAEDGQITAALYWFDGFCDGQRIAYIYAVVTHPDHRNKGLCRLLLQDVHRHLREAEYASALLVPEQEGLRGMYRKLGYTDCTSITEFSCSAGENPVPLRAIGPEEYAMLRRKFLPTGGVVQEGKNLDFFSQQAQFYVGEAVLLAAHMDEDTLFAMELLGSRDAAPGILKFLDCKKGSFRSPGKDSAFAMIHPLIPDAVFPQYLGFAFD